MHPIKKFLSALLCLNHLIPFLVIIASSPGLSQKNASKEILLGGGATFPNVLYQKWFETYYRNHGMHVDYRAEGSGEGLTKLQQRSLDFGASDFLPGAEETKTFTSPILEIATCLGGVATPYNLPGIPELKLNQDALIGIFFGQITKWNDPRILATNPKLSLPAIDIKVVHRSDASGTSFIFSQYLSKIDSAWSNQIGFGKDVKWPVGFGVKGNQGVSDFMSRVVGSISYLEWSYAVENKMGCATLRNQSGIFVLPTVASFYKAAEILPNLQASASLSNTKAFDGYPITSLTWILVYKEQKYLGRTKAHVTLLQDLLLWMVSSQGQAINPTLGFGKLSPLLQEKYTKKILSMTYAGLPIKNIDKVSP